MAIGSDICDNVLNYLYRGGLVIANDLLLNSSGEARVDAGRVLPSPALLFLHQICII